MKRVTHILLFVAMAGGIVFDATVANAQATRTWVSGVGDDVNPCSRTAPCKTFAGAISKTATGGEIDALDPGGFGAVTITKSITIDGGGSLASVLASGTNGIIVNGAGAIVKLRNLEIYGGGGVPGLNGISVANAAAVYIEKSTISGFSTSGVNFAPTAAATLDMVDTTIANNTGVGVLIKPTTSVHVDASLTNVQLTNNAVGLRVEDNAFVGVFKSSITNNTGDGVFAIFNGVVACQILLKSTVIFSNSGRGAAAQAAGASLILSDVALMQNGTNLASVSGGVIASFGTNENTTSGVAGAPTFTVSRQ